MTVLEYDTPSYTGLRYPTKKYYPSWQMDLTDPAIEAVRRIVPSFLWSTGLDFTPLILILLLQAAIMLLNRIYI